MPDQKSCAGFVCLTPNLPNLSMIEIFKKYILERSLVSEEEFLEIAAVSQQRKLRRRQYLLQEGDVCKFNAFVTGGCLRNYTVDAKGNEHIVYFAVENWWTGDRESMSTGNPSRFNIDALEDSEVILISKTDFDHLCKKLPAFNDMINAILQKSFIVAQNRIHTYISQTAEEKYQSFTETFPHLLPRVPLGMIASYLGIAPETLSRIRKQGVRK